MCKIFNIEQFDIAVEIIRWKAYSGYVVSWKLIVICIIDHSDPWYCGYIYRLWYKGFDLKLTFIVISPSIEPFNFYNYIECIPTKKCVNYQRMLSCCGHMLYIFLLFVGYWFDELYIVRPPLIYFFSFSAPDVYIWT